MATINVTRWDFEQEGQLNEAAIRARFQPASAFRIGSFRYPAGTTINGSMRAGTCFVLQGRCQYDFGAAAARLASGDIAQLPEGPYMLQVIDQDELEIVMCWELPRVLERINEPH